jgi:antitoxin component YwqK of YwqJK toxin-antitoxin module
MLFFHSLLFTLLMTICFACKQVKTDPKGKIRRVTFENVIAEGNISSDTIYNGLIKFYDKATNKLVIEGYYKKGKLDGKRKAFYENGKIKNITFYENGKQNGTSSCFDSTGQLTSKQDCYYDLLVGSHIEYKNTKPRKYYFTSFDEEDVFYINYDLLKTER